MDPNNIVVQLCIEGLKSEFQGKHSEAEQYFLQAWDSREDALDACIAAHYVARQKKSYKDVLRWNKKSLRFANCVETEKVKNFYPSLYINIAKAFEQLGKRKIANRYYLFAYGAIAETPLGSYGYLLQQSIEEGLRRTAGDST